MEKINPKQLVLMNDDADRIGYRVEVAYARDDNFLFGERIYRADAGLWLHETLAKAVLHACGAAAQAGYRMVLYDGLRTTTAQERMLHTQRVKDNPHWLEEPRLLSPPGAGAHPRGMAIDVSLETLDGELLDMGTPFDDLSEKAHRDYQHSSEVIENRKILDGFMVGAAQELGIEILALPQEWWDFRFPVEIYEAYVPLSDEDLPAAMRCVD